jgi:hypothetical protein
MLSAIFHGEQCRKTISRWASRHNKPSSHPNPTQRHLLTIPEELAQRNPNAGAKMSERGSPRRIQDLVGI